MSLEREVAGVEQSDICAWDVTLESVGSSRQEEGSLRPQMASSGGLRIRKYSWNAG
jgi:hypothetical protein